MRELEERREPRPPRGVERRALPIGLRARPRDTEPDEVVPEAHEVLRVGGVEGLA